VNFVGVTDGSVVQVKCIYADTAGESEIAAGDALTFDANMVKVCAP